MPPHLSGWVSLGEDREERRPALTLSLFTATRKQRLGEFQALAQGPSAGTRRCWDSSSRLAGPSAQAPPGARQGPQHHPAWAARGQQHPSQGEGCSC